LAANEIGARASAAAPPSDRATMTRRLGVARAAVTIAALLVSLPRSANSTIRILFCRRQISAIARPCSPVAGIRDGWQDQRLDIVDRRKREVTHASSNEDAGTACGGLKSLPGAPPLFPLADKLNAEPGRTMKLGARSISQPLSFRTVTAALCPHAALRQIAILPVGRHRDRVDRGSRATPP